MLNNLLGLSSVALLATLSFMQAALAYELEWDKTKVILELEPGEKEAKAEYTVTNKGQETVQIDRIKTSCGCTGSILDKKIIEPGESTTIIGTFKKGSREGLNQNRLQVFVKDQAEPVEMLHMIVKVPKLIDAKPSMAYWNKESPKTERQVQISLDKRYVNEISGIEYDPNVLTVTEEDSTDNSIDRVLTISPKSFDKQLRQTILIKATGENGMTSEKNIMVFVQP